MILLKGFHIKVLHWITLEQLTNSESRLVTMSVSLRTQIRQPNLSVQILNTRVNFLNVSLTSVYSNLEHGLAILTESFSPLRSVLHNLSCLKSKAEVPWQATRFPFISCTLKLDQTDSHWLEPATANLTCGCKVHQMPSGTFHYYLLTKLNADATSRTWQLHCYVVELRFTSL